MEPVSASGYGFVAGTQGKNDNPRIRFYNAVPAAAMTGIPRTESSRWMDWP
jgi:hypothetical protein